MCRYRLIQAEQAEYPVAILCRVLGAARSGYYAWARRGVSARARADEELAVQIVQSHEGSRRTYGAPRVHAALPTRGVRCGTQRVARPMRPAGLVGCHRRQRARTTATDPAQVPAPNLVARAFATPARDRLWIGEITYMATWEGWLYLAVLLEARSRRVVAWSMADLCWPFTPSGIYFSGLRLGGPGCYPGVPKRPAPRLGGSAIACDDRFPRRGDGEEEGVPLG